jgi:hypothetical protein
MSRRWHGDDHAEERGLSDDACILAAMRNDGSPSDELGDRDDALYLALLTYATSEGVGREAAHTVALMAAQSFMRAVFSETEQGGD